MDEFIAWLVSVGLEPGEVVSGRCLALSADSRAELELDLQLTDERRELIETRFRVAPGGSVAALKGAIAHFSIALVEPDEPRLLTDQLRRTSLREWQIDLTPTHRVVDPQPARSASAPMAMLRTSTNGPAPYSAAAIRVYQGLDGIRYRPALYVGPTQSPRILARYAIDVMLDQAFDCHDVFLAVVLSEDGALELTQRCGQAFSFEDELDGRPRHEKWATELWNAPLARLSESGSRRETHPSIINGLSKVFEIASSVGMAQRYALGRAIGSPSPIAPWSPAGARLRFRPDPGVFDSPLTLEMVRREANEVALRSPCVTIDVNGDELHYPTLEPGARGLLGVQRVWSDAFFVWTITESDFSFRVAIGFSEDPAPFELLTNLYNGPSGPHLEALREALALAVRIGGRDVAPIDQLAGIASLEFPIRSDGFPDVQKLAEPFKARIRDALVEPLSIYLDSIPDSRERLAALWAR